MHPILSIVLFAIVASPETYKLTRSVAGDWVATSDGCAKIGGLILHAIVFALLLTFVYRLLMKKKSTYLTEIKPAMY